MEISFLGGASEVGRLGMLLRHQGITLLFDYGIQPADPPEYPMEAPPVDTLFLSHSHLDHCGMIPVVSRRSETDVLMTSVTSAVANILLEDSIKVSKIEGFPQPYSKQDIKTMNRNILPIGYGDTIEIGGFQVGVHSAGHIPGSSMFEVRGSQTLLFTGDLQTIDTRLVRGARPVGCDVLIMESTYAGRFHPDRAVTEEAFLRKVQDVVERGGVALVPCFAVARTQEILMVLSEMDFDVWLDGMGRGVSQVYLRHPSFLRSVKKMRSAFGRSRIIRSHHGREKALQGEVIVTTSGMLSGGPALFYLDRLKDDPRNAVILTGYQVEGTNGRSLLEEGLIEIYGARTKVTCEVAYYDFSSHADHEDLVSFVEGCDPSTVVLMHGEAREELTGALEGRECILPMEGEWHSF
ncbi:MAG: MBL fold metallo-hydrolase [Thermoplasmata archaeon]